MTVIVQLAYERDAAHTHTHDAADIQAQAKEEYIINIIVSLN